MAAARGQRALQFQIYNRAWNTTLKFHGPRKENYWSFSECSIVRPSNLRSVLSPGCLDSEILLSRSNALGHGWLVIYEAESFTLAIFFFIRESPDSIRKILQLEVSLDKAHLGDFRETFERMAALRDPPEPDKTVVSRAEFSSSHKVSVRLLAGPMKVSANVSRDSIPDLKVLLEGRAMPQNQPLLGPLED